MQYIWVDNSDISGPLLRRIFPGALVLEDSTHLIRRYMRTLLPDHPQNRKIAFPCIASRVLFYKVYCCIAHALLCS